MVSGVIQESDAIQLVYYLMIRMDHHPSKGNFEFPSITRLNQILDAYGKQVSPSFYAQMKLPSVIDMATRYLTIGDKPTIGGPSFDDKLREEAIGFLVQLGKHFGFIKGIKIPSIPDLNIILGKRVDPIHVWIMDMPEIVNAAVHRFNDETRRYANEPVQHSSDSWHSYGPAAKPAGQAPVLPEPKKNLGPQEERKGWRQSAFDSKETQDDEESEETLVDQDSEEPDWGLEPPEREYAWGKILPKRDGWVYTTELAGSGWDSSTTGSPPGFSSTTSTQKSSTSASPPKPVESSLAGPPSPPVPAWTASPAPAASASGSERAPPHAPGRPTTQQVAVTRPNVREYEVMR